MKKIFRLSIIALLMGHQAYAGNPQRAGSAGAAELLINPWARNTGWMGVNVAGVSGVESTFLNIAGTAQVERTEVSFANTQWLVNSGININAFGFNQKVGANGVLGASVVAHDYGEWDITTEQNPDGGIGSVSPTTAIIGVSYAQKFIESIRGGVNIKLYTSSSQNLNVSAVAFDAGVQYVTGDEQELKFGVTLRNVGPSASYKGDGLSVVLTAPQSGTAFQQAYNQRSAQFELPTSLTLGGSYDFNFSGQRVTVAGSFQSNSFQKDEYTVGAEYSFKDIAMIRAGYTVYDNSDFEQRTTVFSGLGMGVSFDVPLGESTFKLDYSYRDTDPFQGVHSIGLGFNL